MSPDTIAALARLTGTAPREWRVCRDEHAECGIGGGTLCVHRRGQAQWIGDCARLTADSDGDPCEAVRALARAARECAAALAAVED